MKKYTETYDQLGYDMRLHYRSLVPIQPAQETQDMRVLQDIVRQREGIRLGLTDHFKRRTYHAEYVTHSNDTASSTRYINSIDQMNVRNYEELDTHYYCDEYGDNTVIPFICQLPARDHKEQWIYGYRYSDWDGQTIFLDVREEKADAMRSAESRAEEHAQSCYEDHEQQREELRREETAEAIHNCKVELAGLRAVLREQVSIVRALRTKEHANRDVMGKVQTTNAEAHNVRVLGMLWHNRTKIHNEISRLDYES